MVTERSIDSPLVFIEAYKNIGTFSDFVSSFLLEYWEKQLKEVKSPDVYYFLDIDPYEALKRIGQRKRLCETVSDTSYLLQLQTELKSCYLSFFASQNKPYKIFNSLTELSVLEKQVHQSILSQL
jgi:thymidylate kinase